MVVPEWLVPDSVLGGKGEEELHQAQATLFVALVTPGADCSLNGGVAGVDSQGVSRQSTHEVLGSTLSIYSKCLAS